MTAGLRLLVSCVGENRPDWFVKVQNLVLSVRLLAERSAGVPIVVNFVGGVEPEYSEALAALDADVRVVERLDPRAPSSNKLRMLELAGTDDFDVLVMLDCDIVVRGDFASAAGSSMLRMVPAIGNPYPPALWREIYRTLALPLPSARTVMTATGERSYPYYNSGVIFVPRHLCSPLLDAWNQARNAWFDLTADRRETFNSKHGGRPTITQDQPSLSCALAKSGLPVDPLPINLNLRTFGPGFAKYYRDQWGPPFMFHYHQRIDPDGFLVKSPYRRIAPYLHDFNIRRAGALGLPPPSPMVDDRVGVTLRRLGRNARKRLSHRMTILRTRSADRVGR